jgi:ribosomal protein L9
VIGKQTRTQADEDQMNNLLEKLKNLTEKLAQKELEASEMRNQLPEAINVIKRKGTGFDKFLEVELAELTRQLTLRDNVCSFILFFLRSFLIPLSCP